MSEKEEFLDEAQKRFLKKHWKMTLVFAGVFAGAVTAAILVFLWFIGIAQANALVPSTIGAFSIGSLITLILHAIFWELVGVVWWVIVIVLVIYFKWYRSLPAEDRWVPKRGTREESEAFGFFIGIAWLIVVYLDGRWDLAFDSWTLNDWIYSALAACGWIFLIIGIPVGLAFLWWINKERKQEP